jgi:uncharacterized membrane protein YdfJ with MMPL/SSD domain
VPSVAVTIGKANWWPSRPHRPAEPAKRAAARADDGERQLSLF